MNFIGKSAALVEWARKWPELGGRLKLNALDAGKPGDAAIMPVSNDATINKYIDGTADRMLTVELRMALSWSDGLDASNAEAMRKMESWAQWVGEQYPANVPDFGKGAKVTGIEPVGSIPEPALVYQDTKTAEYSFSARIYYTE